eukprot:9467800-Pyramimonas_sp.AAC.1
MAICHSFSRSPRPWASPRSIRGRSPIELRNFTSRFTSPSGSSSSRLRPGGDPRSSAPCPVALGGRLSPGRV